VPELAQGHFLCDQLNSAGLDLLPLGGLSLLILSSTFMAWLFPFFFSRADERRNGHQPFGSARVEAFFRCRRFISCHEQDRLTLRIESKGHPPLTIGRAEAQLLHIRVREPFSVSARGRFNCGPNCWRRRAIARISVRTSSCSASNSGSNSSPISTTQLTDEIWHMIHMMSTPYIPYEQEPVVTSWVAARRL